MTKSISSSPREIYECLASVQCASTGPIVSATVYQCNVCKCIHAEHVDACVCCDEEKLKVKKVCDGKS